MARTRIGLVCVTVCFVGVGLLWGMAACSHNGSTSGASNSPSATRRPTPSTSATKHPTPTPTPLVTPAPAPPPPPATGASYPWHTDIVATTFWVGEIFDPTAADGSQMLSTYDSDWFGSYGGCDGIEQNGSCETERRGASNAYFPTAMTPLENPFYLDLPFDDINDPEGFAMRDQVIPWAAEYADHAGDSNFSYLKNRWVQLRLNGVDCYGQIEDAGPGEYHDAAYVFGSDDARPVNTRYGGAGMDVSPAITGCLGFSDLDGITGGIEWRFVDAADVPAGPWTLVTTTSGVR